MTQILQKFIRLDSLPGVLLIGATLLAMIVANSPFEPLYQGIKDTKFIIGLGSFAVDKPLILWVNDGLMAIFFFLIGLELKREWLTGNLRDPKARLLPFAGAVGGFALPALIYFAFNAGNDAGLRGWAIPAATDIAFALGILVLLGSKAPLSLKVFLTSLAIFDDVAAVAVIALFYTEQLSVASLGIAGLAIVALGAMNYAGVSKKRFYVFVGLIVWLAVLKSGVHATLAGIATGLFIPITPKDDGKSLLHEFEHALHAMVVYFVLPTFAFFNAGLSLAGFGITQLAHPVPLGITVGLILGKQLGVFGFCWLAIKTGIAKLPEGTSTSQLYGVSVLTGIGFTMSLFISGLAFPAGSLGGAFDPRAGILIGSTFCAIQGYVWLSMAAKRKRAPKSAVYGEVSQATHV